MKYPLNLPFTTHTSFGPFLFRENYIVNFYSDIEKIRHCFQEPSLPLSGFQINRLTSLTYGVFENSFPPSARPTSRHIWSQFGQRSPKESTRLCPVPLRTRPATPPSSGPNLPQSVTHIWRKAIFKHTLAQILSVGRDHLLHPGIAVFLNALAGAFSVVVQNVPLNLLLQKSNHPCSEELYFLPVLQYLLL